MGGGLGREGRDTISEIREGVDESSNVVGDVVILGIQDIPLSLNGTSNAFDRADHFTKACRESAWSQERAESSGVQTHILMCSHPTLKHLERTAN